MVFLITKEWETKFGENKITRSGEIVSWGPPLTEVFPPFCEDQRDNKLGENRIEVWSSGDIVCC